MNIFNFRHDILNQFVKMFIFFKNAQTKFNYLDNNKTFDHFFSKILNILILC